MKQLHNPPEPIGLIPLNVAQQYLDTEINTEELKVLSGACDFAAAELGAQPYLRQKFKQHFYKYGSITTTPTEKGVKDIDVFHPSYRVKRITDEQLSNFHPLYREERKSRDQPQDDEIFLDVI